MPDGEGTALAAVQYAAADCAAAGRLPLATRMLAHRRAFIQQNTCLQRPPFVPELQLYLADAITPLWQMTEAELGARGVPPPFWAFAWAGGLALARYLLDHPVEVTGQRVLDFAAGSGLCAIAALRAGAQAASAADVDPF